MHKGPTEEFLWTRRRWLKASPNDRSVWASPAKNFTVTQGMGLTLNLMAKQYKPLPDDKDTYTWISNGGSTAQLACPPYAISDVDDAQRTLNRYVEDNTIRYIEEHVSTNMILWESFSMALRMSNSKSVRPHVVSPLVGHTFFSNMICSHSPLYYGTP